MTASVFMSLAFYALVAETMTIILLIIPLISPAIWSRIFSSNICKIIKKRAKIPFFAAIILMGIIFFDASRIERETRKNKEMAGPDSDHHNIEYFNAKLFRAQRDLYIAGFGLFFVFVIYRLIIMVSDIARLDASCTAAIKQAESASRAISSMGKGSEKSGDKDNTANYKVELEKKDKEISKLQKEIEALKSQSEGLAREYDRLADEHTKKTSSGSVKKSD